MELLGLLVDLVDEHAHLPEPVLLGIQGGRIIGDDHIGNAQIGNGIIGNAQIGNGQKK